MNIKNIFYLIIMISISSLQGQVIASDDVVLCDGQQGEVPVTLTATSYAVDLNDSNIYTDDIFGGVINMGFDFVFYGNTYNQVVLASNNYLSFNITNAGAYSDWTIGAAVPTTTEPETQNAILCPWQDIYPGVNGNGTIQYATTGEEPNRVFIASFCGIPMFSCTDICYSSQIKLFESTNIIETHIAEKVLCTTWNSGAAIHALHNEDGTIAHVVTGLDGIERNYPNQWTCQNDGWRFTPNGDDDYLIENIEFAPAVAGTDIIWQDEFGNQIGTGSEITVFPGGDVTYTAGASLCGSAGDWCGFEGGIEGDDVSITFEELPIAGDIIAEISCFEANDGAVTITAPDEGEWIYNLYLGDVLYSSQESLNDEETFNGLQPGSYYATVTEINSGCVSEEWNFEITEPDEIIYINTIQNVTCYDGDDGMISIELSGGTPTYNVTLNQMQSGEEIDSQSGSIITFDNLTAGDYWLFPSDSNDCEVAEDEVFFSISEPNEIVISDISSNYGGYGVSCFGASDGFIDITVDNCINCTYEWSNGALSEDLTEIEAGIYSVTVSDENGCVKSISVEITESEVMSITETHSNYNDYGVSCFGASDGFIEVSVDGGAGNYTYVWSNGAETENLTNLIAGTYSVDVIDQNGCNISIIVDILEPTELILSELHSSDTDVDFCDDYSDGWIDLSVSGGVGIYNYNWSNEENFTSNEEDVNNLSSGAYTIEVEDENGCIKFLTIPINENEELVLNSSVSECIEENNGSIDITMEGCSGNCTYQWSTGDTTPNISNLAAGEYSIEVTDNFGCEISQDFIINKKPQADFETNDYQFYLSNSPTEFIDLSNDTDIAVWAWNFGDGSATVFYTNPSHIYTEPGTYYVSLSITDSYGCTDEIVKKLEVMQEYYSYTPSIFTPNNDGLNDVFKPSLFNINTSSYQLTIFDRWGKALFNTTDYNQGWNGLLENGESLPSDIYTYQIRYNTNSGEEQEESGKLIMAK